MAKRKPIRPKPRSDKPNQYWGMDMTKVKIGGFGWIYVHVVLDWYSKEIVGCSCSFQSKTVDWLEALNQAVNQRFCDGIRNADSRLSLITDNGCQPTSTSFMKECSELGIKQIFTTWNNPKGNADTERVIRTIKEDLVWTVDWQDPFAFEAALNDWVNQYNTDYPHQSLNYLTPNQAFSSYASTKQLKREVIT